MKTIRTLLTVVLAAAAMVACGRGSNDTNNDTKKDMFTLSFDELQTTY